VPPLNRIVLVESGPREILERLLPNLYPHAPSIDVVTCYAMAPSNFDPTRGRIYNTNDYPGSDARKRLYTELWQNSYAAIGILCADSPIMTKWKWAITAHLPGKLFIVNENCDYFWVDRGNWKTVAHFVLFRAGLSGADAVKTLTQLAVFPFTVIFLLTYAAWVHLRRRPKWPAAITR
jgi:hypothetical protein